MLLFIALSSSLVLQLCAASGLPGDGILFPPPLVQVEGEPLGHLKPYGLQNAPEGPVKEYSAVLPAEEFWQNHVKDSIPLVYRQGISKSPALKLWTDQYLTETYGSLDVLVELKKENRTSSSGRMRLRDFLTIYEREEVYVVSMLPSEMMQDIQAVPSVLCGTFKNYTHESNLWVSNGGTRSVIHYDADHNLHCLIAGRKDFIMIANKHSEDIYFGPKPSGVGSAYSELDPDVVDMNKYPNHGKVPWTWATLYAGDCIFIPSIYIHQVRSYGRSIAATTLFTADIEGNFTSTDCTDDIMQTYHNMTAIDFRWTYKKGDPTIDMGFMNDELTRERLRECLRADRFSNKDGKMYWKHFIRFGLHFPHKRIARNHTISKAIFDKLAGSKGYIDMDMVNNFSREDVKTVVRLIESPHGIVTDGQVGLMARPGERAKFEDGPLDEAEVTKIIKDAKVTQRQMEQYMEEVMSEGDDEQEPDNKDEGEGEDGEREEGNKEESDSPDDDQEEGESQEDANAEEEEGTEDQAEKPTEAEKDGGGTKEGRDEL